MPGVGFAARWAVLSCEPAHSDATSKPDRLSTSALLEDNKVRFNKNRMARRKRRKRGIQQATTSPVRCRLLDLPIVSGSRPPGCYREIQPLPVLCHVVPKLPTTTTASIRARHLRICTTFSSPVACRQSSWTATISKARITKREAIANVNSPSMNTSFLHSPATASLPANAGG